MNKKRALLFGIMAWVFTFVIISILIFTPWVKESDLRVQVIWWILEIPLVLLLAKWYFREDPPTTKKGFFLGLIGLLTGVVLDLIITIPLFISQQSDKPFADFYGDWKMWVGFGIFVLLTTYAGYEFDATYTKAPESTQEVNKSEKS